MWIKNLFIFSQRELSKLNGEISVLRRWRDWYRPTVSHRTEEFCLVSTLEWLRKGMLTKIDRSSAHLYRTIKSFHFPLAKTSRFLWMSITVVLLQRTVSIIDSHSVEFWVFSKRERHEKRSVSFLIFIHWTDVVSLNGSAEEFECRANESSEQRAKVEF